MNDMVNSRNPDERRTNYRPYLETQSDYLLEIGKYQEAKEIFGDKSLFTDDERRKAIRRIEIAEGFARKG